MIWDEDFDEQTVGDDDRDLIADNLQRIKDSIYGNGEDPSASRGTRRGTPTRDSED